MNNNLINLTVILDRSGSMSIIWDDMIGGLKNFVNEQKEYAKKNNKEIKISLIIFDDKYDVICNFRKINEFEIDEKKYLPRGMTALLDAVGKSINSICEKLNNLSDNDKPGKNLFVIITDGQENSSKEFKSKKIKEMIEHQKNKYNWEFIFLGANQDSFTEASNIGINKNKTLNYQANRKGINNMYNSVNNFTQSYYEGKKEDLK